MNASLIFSFLILIGFSVPSSAKVYFEPVVGIGSSSVSGSNTANSIINTYEAGYSTPALGFRVGGFYDYLFVGLDVKAMYGIPGNYTSSLTSAEKPESSLFYSVGFGFGVTAEYIPIRWYLSIDPLTQVDASGVTVSSMGYRFGIGYFFNLNTAINLEIHTVDFATSADSTTVDAKFQGYFLTLSFPLEYDYPNIPWKSKYEK